MFVLPKLAFFVTIISTSYCQDNHQRKYLVCEQQPLNSLYQSTLRGPPGRTGKHGPSGKKGESGQPGGPGMRGVKGERGEPGLQGSEGLPGYKGEPGGPGIKGVKGDRGEPGLDGLDGLSGDKGEPGGPGMQGAKGRRGGRGFRGQSGPPGPQPLADWTRIDNRLQEIINEQRICTGVVYRDHCYWLPWTVATRGGHGGKSAAASVCSSYGATLVDIETAEMHDALYKYIQTAWLMYVDRPTMGLVDVWLASSCTNRNAVSSRGGSVYTRWAKGNPNHYTNHGIGWGVGTKPTRPPYPNGMWTTYEGDPILLPFCRL